VNSDTLNNAGKIIENLISKIMYTDPSTVHTFVVPKNVKYVHVTMIGGGGAGGVGFAKNMCYYSGGGGGSGAYILNRPVSVTPGAILKITVGRGSDIRHDTQGKNTIIEITHPNKTKDTIVANGGYNGNPSLDKNPDVSGGAGGTSNVPLLRGQNGDNGMISLPSQPFAQGGDGGASLFYPGTGGTVNNLLDQMAFLRRWWPSKINY
jgi:hypothetical protein